MIVVLSFLFHNPINTTYGSSKILDLENKGVTIEEIHSLSKNYAVIATAH